MVFCKLNDKSQFPQTIFELYKDSKDLTPAGATQLKTHGWAVVLVKR